MPTCPFDNPTYSIGYDTPCPVCGALGGDDDAWDKCAAATIGPNAAKEADKNADEIEAAACAYSSISQHTADK